MMAAPTPTPAPTMPAARAVATEPPRRLPAGLGLASVAPVAAMVAASVLWLSSLGHVDLRDLTDIGLISALPPSFFLAIAVLTAGFFLEIARREGARPAVLWAHLGLAVVFLQGVVSVVEGAPRFPTSWIHAGFTDQIADHHTTLPMLDARFSWPGFFSVAALVETVAGLDSALWFVRWAPVVFGLVTLLPAAVIVRTALVDDRARWTALWIFCVGNWVGQDYFAPQALNFLLYLVVLAILLQFFRPSVPRPVPFFSRVPSREAPVAPLPPRARVALVAVIVAVFAASTVSHQLTPFALAAAAAALVVSRRCELTWLPVLFVVGAIAWVSFGAEAYWVGHLSDVTGGVGKLSGSLQSGVGQRIGGSSGHVFVLRLRMAATVLLYAVAAVGAVRSWRQTGGVPWPHLLLMLAPFTLVGVQSYGGEILLRVYLFSLPFLALLVALAFCPGSPGVPGGEPRSPGRKPIVAAGALSLAIAVAFLAIRYGNERFESFTDNEVAAVEWVYENAPAGARVVAVNPSLPWKHRDITKFSYISQVQVPHLDEAAELLDYMTAKPRADGLLILTRSQVAHGELVQGLPPGWDENVTRLLLSTGKVKVVFQNEDAVVLLHDKEAM